MHLSFFFVVLVSLKKYLFKSTGFIFFISPSTLEFRTVRKYKTRDFKDKYLPLKKKKDYKQERKKKKENTANHRKGGKI